MADASRTVCSIVHLIIDCVGERILVEDIGKAYKGLKKVVTREVDTMALREVNRLLQLGFFG